MSTDEQKILVWVGIPGVIVTTILMVGLVAWIGWPTTKPKPKQVATAPAEPAAKAQAPTTKPAMTDAARERAKAERSAKIERRRQQAEAARKQAQEDQKRKQAEAEAAKAASQPKTWTLDSTVDSFGDPTGTVQLSGQFFGTMSNSATTGSDITAVCQLAKIDGVLKLSFTILEYGRSPLTYNEYSKMLVQIKVDGVVAPVRPEMLFSHYMLFGKAHTEVFTDTLASGQTIGVHIMDVNTPSSTWTFKIDPDNFQSSMLKSIKD